MRFVCVRESVSCSVITPVGSYFGVFNLGKEGNVLIHAEVYICIRGSCASIVPYRVSRFVGTTKSVARARARSRRRGLIRGPREDSSVSIASGEHRSSPSCVTIFERRSTVDSTENYYYYYYCQNGSGMWVGGK